VDRAPGEEAAVLKMQRAILTIFTLITFFLHLSRLESETHAGKTANGISLGAGATPRVTLATEPLCKSRVAPARHGVTHRFKLNRF